MTMLQQDMIIRERRWAFPSHGTRLTWPGAIWLQRTRTREALRRLDARARADVGITEAQQTAECRKWFWQA